MRIGSLFSGAGGLDMAVEAVFGGETVWHAEIDKAASKVLAHRYPGVPNLGDITQVDWAHVPAVEILSLGFPCQDVSAAGKRAGIKQGTRSGLWSVAADAIEALQPQIVVVENVRGLLSATAHRMEPEATTLGDGAGRPVLRAAGAVLGDLSDLGYDAQWATVAAADVGAPHRRERVFIVATAADTGHGNESKRARASWREAGERQAVGSIAGRSGDTDLAFLPTPSTHDKTGARSPESIARMDKPFANLNDTAVNELLPTPTTQDGSNNGGPSQFQRNTLPLNAEVTLLPTPNASDCTGGGAHPDNREGHSRQLIDYALLAGSTAWGKYEPAIRRWESLTRPAPAPTEPNKNGNPRLAAAFSEWLMGWPDGWVTDPAIGISRNDQLRIVGNGVCPQQAAAALRFLLEVAG
jgi:DNA (cytosine-5)-methyltransferase 1